MTNKKRVYHVNQKYTEAFEFSKIHGWVKVEMSTADNWKPGTYTYHEIRYDETKNTTKNGCIIW